MKYPIQNLMGRALILSLTVFLISCGKSSDPEKSAPEPTPFLFNTESFAPLLRTVTSDTVVIAGLEEEAEISIIGGKYSLNGSTPTEEQGRINNGDSLTVSLKTADEHLAENVARITVGAYSAEFTVTTGIQGAWSQICRAGSEGLDELACESDPWSLGLGESFLGGPGTMVSEGAACDGDQQGTYRFTEGQLVLFRCNSEAENGGTPGGSGQGQRFEMAFDQLSKVLTLDNGSEVYFLEPKALPTETLTSQRLIRSLALDCVDENSEIEYQEIGESEVEHWNSTLAYQGDKLFMDEFFDNSVDTSVGTWSFYEADDRGAQSATYPAEAGLPMFEFRVVHGPDLRPLSAVGHEADCAGEISDENFKAWEIDFEREVSYRRYWNDEEITVDTEGVSEIDVTDLSGNVKEVLVTVNVASGTDASDLELQLRAPNGTTVVLANAQNGNGTINSFQYTSFADYGVASVEDENLTTFENLLVPEEPLDSLSGSSLNGEWQLKVNENGSGATITYFGLSLR